MTAGHGEVLAAPVGEHRGAAVGDLDVEEVETLGEGDRAVEATVAEQRAGPPDAQDVRPVDELPDRGEIDVVRTEGQRGPRDLPADGDAALAASARRVQRRADAVTLRYLALAGSFGSPGPRVPWVQTI